jgi:hypothetical protein
VAVFLAGPQVGRNALEKLWIHGRRNGEAGVLNDPEGVSNPRWYYESEFTFRKIPSLKESNKSIRKVMSGGPMAPGFRGSPSGANGNLPVFAQHILLQSGIVCG